MTVWFDYRAFVESMDALEDRIDSAAHSAFVKSAQEAAATTTEYNYQNRTGELTASREVRDERYGPWDYSVQVRWAAKHAKWVDQGTPPHRIAARRAKMLRWYSYGRPVFRYAVWHPGAKKAGFSECASFVFDNTARPVMQGDIDATITSDGNNA